MKVWRSLRKKARATTASASASLAVGQCAPPRAGCWCRRGSALIVQTKRSQRSLPVTSRASDVLAATSGLVVGDRRVDLGEMAADLLFGRPARRQADREPRDRRARAVDEGEVLFEGEREQGARPARGGEGGEDGADRRVAVADGRAAGVESPAEPRRLASGSCRRASSSRGRCPGSCAPLRRRGREAAPARRLRASTAAPGRRSCRAPRSSRAGAVRRARSP